ncbi:MAG TPA: hypothetical protein PLW88_08845 [Syntrophorhabdaceae bacterium]|nr:hypothetical protein [Syntrophorhabdaceae bacterium]
MKKRLDSDRAILYSVVAFVIIGGFVYSLMLGDKLRFQDGKQSHKKQDILI